MSTSIQVSVDLLNELKRRKLHPRESYEDVIRDLLEGAQEFDEQTKQDINKARAEIKSGNYYCLDEVKQELGL